MSDDTGDRVGASSEGDLDETRRARGHDGDAPPPTSTTWWERNRRKLETLAAIATLATAGISLTNYFASRSPAADNGSAPEVWAPEVQALICCLALVPLVIEPIYTVLKDRARLSGPAGAERAERIRSLSAAERYEVATARERFNRIVFAQFLFAPFVFVLVIGMFMWKVEEVVILGFVSILFGAHVALRVIRDPLKDAALLGRTWNHSQRGSVPREIREFVFGRDLSFGPSPAQWTAFLVVVGLSVLAFGTHDGFAQLGMFRDRFVRVDDDPSSRPEPDESPAANLELAPPPASSSQEDAGEEPLTWQIEAGDSLWTIAEAELERRLGREATEIEIRRFWLALMSVNAGNLRYGGQFDLIFPDDELDLPGGP